MPVSTVSSNSMITADSPSPNSHIIPPSPPQLNVPPVSSMVEYNLHRLASISNIDNNGVATDLTDQILPTVGQTVGSNFLLDEMLNGGDQMLNNLQALAKIGDLNNGNALNPLSMMDNYNISNSPLLQTPQSALTGINDDIKLNCFSPFSNTTQSPDAAKSLFAHNLNGAAGRAKALSMQIRVKFGALGQARGQFNSPHGFCLGLDEEIIVADTNNHRIEVSSTLIIFKYCLLIKF